jgi:hypothetical protein
MNRKRFWQGSYASQTRVKPMKVRIPDANSPNGVYELDADMIHYAGHGEDQAIFVDIHLEDPDAIKPSTRDRLKGNSLTGVVVEEVAQASVPKRAEWLAYLLLPRSHRESMLGDLEEEFHTTIAAKFGLRRARFWYWWQVVRSIVPLLSRRLTKLAFLGGIVDLLRRWL